MTTPSPLKTDPHILNLLVCPVALTPLLYDAEQQILRNPSSGYIYKIENAVPLMVVNYTPHI